MKRSLLLNLIIIAHLIAQPIFGQTIVNSDITTNTKWSGQILVQADIRVIDDVTLTIEPGTEILFDGYYGLFVEGTVLSKGELGKEVYFDASDPSDWDNFSTTDGGWKGIRFDYQQSMFDNDTSVFEHTILRHGKAMMGGNSSGNTGGGLYIRNYDKVKFVNSYVGISYAEDFGGGIFLYNSRSQIINSYVYECRAGTAGGAMKIWNGRPRIHGNFFSNNSAPSGGAIKFQESKPEIYSNIFVNNECTHWGGALLVTSGNPILVNNTFANNKAGSGGGICVQPQNDPVFYNNIFWGNTPDQIYLQQVNPTNEFYFNNIQGGLAGITLGPGSVFSGTYTGNINVDPQFSNPSGGAGTGYTGYFSLWTLMANSPCINSGTNDALAFDLPKLDAYKNDRFRYSLLDMGGSEYGLGELNVCGSIESNTVWTADTVKVNCDITVNSGVTLTINAGVTVQFQGPYSIINKGRILAKGTRRDSIYFTIHDTTGFSNPATNSGGWKGIEFSASPVNDSSIFTYIVFDHGKRVDDLNNDDYGGAIFAYQNGKLRVDHSVFRNNFAKLGGAIRSWGANILVQNSKFINNRSINDGGAIDILFSNVSLLNCDFENNTSGSSGGAVDIYVSDPLIHNCSFINNYAGSDGGGLYSRNFSEPEIMHCRFIQNEGRYGGGAYISPSGTVAYNIFTNNTARITGGGLYLFLEEALVHSNLVVNNTSGAGGGIYLNASYTDLINNTIAHNEALSGNGGGIYSIGSDPHFINTIVFGNTASSGGTQIYLQNQPQANFSNLLVEGGVSAIITSTGAYSGTASEVIDADADFMLPSTGPGTVYDGSQADWRLKSTSAAIEAGLNPPVLNNGILVDLQGNDRLNAQYIDLGAFENQGSGPGIRVQPFGKIKCEGENVTFFVVPSDSVEYQWKKNGVAMPGETNMVLELPSISVDDQGAYSCELTNAYGLLESNAAFLITTTAPEILIEPSSGWTGKGFKTKIGMLASGSEPLNVQWYKDDVPIPGANNMDLVLPNTGYIHEGRYKASISNLCGTAETETISLYVAPGICMVTNDSLTGNNLVVWEKRSSAPIVQYNVYREGVVAGRFEPIGSLDADDLSVFEDLEADPRKQAYRYKITAVDTAGRESDLEYCKAHKTMHLLLTVNPETNFVQCDWNPYQGFNYGTFSIFRGNNLDRISPFDQIASTSNTWTDTETTDDEIRYYRVAVLRPSLCVPTGNAKKAGSGPYSYSLSNIEDNRASATAIGEKMNRPEFRAYPNPFDRQTRIEFYNPDHSEYTLYVRDMTGKLVRTVSGITEDYHILDRKGLAAGMYHVIILGDNIYKGKILIE